MKKGIVKAECILLCVACVALPLMSQTLMMQPRTGDKTTVGLRFLRPNFDVDELGLSVLSGVYHLNVSAPVREDVSLICGLPFATFKMEDMDTEQGIGNLFFGLQHRGSTGIYTTAGLYIPTIDDDEWLASWLALMTDYFDLYQFAPDIMTLYLNFAKTAASDKQFDLNFEAGPIVWIPTKDQNDNDVEFLLHYGIAAVVHGSPVDLSVEFVGNMIISEDIDDFSDRFMNVVTFGVSLSRGQVRPGLFYQIPMEEDISEIVKSVLGIRIMAEF
ncbi:hypothetical protein JW948_17420 [bacterium]|nr:hypothetical protein [bacterium]